jgi:Sec-independent protein translocase protein TatA
MKGLGQGVKEFKDASKTNPEEDKKTEEKNN